MDLLMHAAAAARRGGERALAMSRKDVERLLAKRIARLNEKSATKAGRVCEDGEVRWLPGERPRPDRPTAPYATARDPAPVAMKLRQRDRGYER